MVMLLVPLLTAVASKESCADDAATKLPLSIDSVSLAVREMQYAVRGRLLDRAAELEAQLKAGASLPFNRTVKCNIGNPQALGQKPLSFVRRTLSLLINPELLEAAPASYPSDVVTRAKAYIGAVPSVGAYSDSQGVPLVREHVASFISERDGHAASADDIFLTDGASAGVKALMQLMVRGPQDAVLAPIPQYPLYSAVTTLLNGTLAGYYLDEASSWGVVEPELKRALLRASEQGATARAIVVINPGNPTGQSLPTPLVHMILRFAAENNLVLFAVSR
jgi:alanine transaminase